MTEKLDEQVDPRIVQLKLLSDIKEGLLNLHSEIEAVKKLQESQIAEGIVEPLKPRTVTTAGVVVRPTYHNKPWFGVKFTNDGPQSVWIIVNTEKSSTEPQELKSGETWGCDFKTAVIEDMHLATRTGTAVVRIRGIR